MDIAAITLVRDAEKYIIPHLKMYKGVKQNIALFIPQQLKGGSHGHSDQRDSSFDLIKEYCPEVEIHQTHTNEWGAKLFNEALDLVKGCDKVVMFHADVVLTTSNWEKFVKLIRETDYDVYKLDMKKCTINYYHDLEHGVRDCLDIEPVAVKSHIRFNNIYDYTGTTYLIDKDFENHHFTGWKGIFATKDWLEGKVPSESNIYIYQLAPFTPAPQEIKNIFESSPRPR